MPKKQMKKSRKNMKKGGSCGCANSHSHDAPMIKSPDFFAGGSKSRNKTSKRKIRGGVALGPASLPADFDTNRAYSYSLNDHVNDPLNPSVQVAARQLPNMTSGGKKGRRKFSKKNKSKKRGGAQDPLLASYNNNVLSSSNTLRGASVGANILSGNVESQNYDTTFKTPMFL